MFLVILDLRDSIKSSWSFVIVFSRSSCTWFIWKKKKECFLELFAFSYVEFKDTVRGIRDELVPSVLILRIPDVALIANFFLPSLARLHIFTLKYCTSYEYQAQRAWESTWSLERNWKGWTMNVFIKLACIFIISLHIFFFAFEPLVLDAMRSRVSQSLRDARIRAARPLETDSRISCKLSSSSRLLSKDPVCLSSLKLHLQFALNTKVTSDGLH